MTDKQSYSQKRRGYKCAAIDREIGSRIRRIRIARGMSQELVARAMGLTFQQVQKYEKGTNSVASARMPQLCEILQCSPLDLIPWNAKDKKAAALDPVPELSSYGMALAMRIDKMPDNLRSGFRGLIDAVSDR